MFTTTALSASTLPPYPSAGGCVYSLFFWPQPDGPSPLLRQCFALRSRDCGLVVSGPAELTSSVSHRVALKLLVFTAGGAGEHELLIPVGHCGTFRIVYSAIPTVHNILRCRADLFVGTKTCLRKTEARQRRRRTRWRGHNSILIVKTPFLSRHSCVWGGMNSCCLDRLDFTARCHGPSDMEQGDPKDNTRGRGQRGGGDVGSRRNADGFLFPLFLFRLSLSLSFVWRYGGKETGEPC